MKMYSDSEISGMDKLQLMDNFRKLQQEYEDLQNDYDNLDESYGELEDENWDLQEQIDELNSYDYENLVDMDYLKEKLEFYGFKTEELWNFLGDYMRLYNKG